MNREIKFRVYDPEVKAVYVVENWEELMMSDVMQFTGLKDKNGKEIYEGDILQYEGKNNKNHTSGYHFRVVEWKEDKGCWRFKKVMKKCYGKNIDTLKDQAILPKVMKKHQVIGNIYENPELLI